MNIVFFGSSKFAQPSLNALIYSRHKISCVVTQPDRQKGRGLSLHGTAIKDMAVQAGLKVYQPDRINNSATREFLGDLKADLFVVSSYGQILSQIILDIPKTFSINTHASLLPKYRGASPINWALINGDKVTGVSIIKMSKELDAGPLILSGKIDIKDEDTNITLEDRLSLLAADLLMDSIKHIEDDNCKFVAQDERMATIAPKLKKEEGFINWENSAQDIHNRVRGCLGWPGSFTYYKGKILKIYKTKIVSVPQAEDSLAPGQIVTASKDGITVRCGKENLIIEELQLEGRRRMNAQEFTAGHKICAAEAFGKK